MRISKLALAGLLALGSTVYAQEDSEGGDPQAGALKFNTCRGCHSVPGYTNAYPTYHVPKLGGQHSDYTVAALTAYQQGSRTHPTMIANAANLGPGDMADIAAYLATLPSDPNPRTPPRGNPQAGKTKAAACTACHGEDGNGANPQFPRLAGQYPDYLVKALADYKSGERQNAIMNGIAAALTAQDRLDLAAWFAGQDDGLSTVPTD